MHEKAFDFAMLMVSYIVVAGILFIVSAWQITIKANGVHWGSVLVFGVSVVMALYCNYWLMKLVKVKIKELSSNFKIDSRG